jgi:hypothetical protein
LYDGIKIECNLSDRRKWDASLSLIGRHAEKTGEVLPLASDCKVHGCTFSRVPTNFGAKHIFQGSVHRFFNKGRENNNDYSLSDFKDTIKTLKQQYGINPRRSKVVNFEFGVNISLPPGVEAQDFQKYLVSAYSKGFEKLNPRRAAVGYIAEFNEYSIKIYDKGFQGRTGETNKIRVEIKVNRTRWLDQFNFDKGKELYIDDLLNKHNIKILGDILDTKISSLILTPRKVDKSKLSPKQRETFAECRDARSWEEWSSKQRKDKRKQLSAIFKKVGQPDPVDVLRRLVKDKWNELTTENERQQLERQKACEKVTFSSLFVIGVRDLFNLLLKSHEHINYHLNGYMIYLPRGEPLPSIPPPIALDGYTRWIDNNCRSPPALLR